MDVNQLIKRARALLLEPFKMGSHPWPWVKVLDGKKYAIKGAQYGQTCYYWHHDGQIYFTEPFMKAKAPQGLHWRSV